MDPRRRVTISKGIQGEAGQDADWQFLVAERELLAREAGDVTARSDGDAGVDVDGAKTREVTSRVIAPPFDVENCVH